jgi:hypothetical protein
MLLSEFCPSMSSSLLALLITLGPSFAPPCAKPQPPIAIATRLATLAIVPVKRAWMALKPVSNGEPCAMAATGIRKVC